MSRGPTKSTEKLLLSNFFQELMLSMAPRLAQLQVGSSVLLAGCLEGFLLE